ncbi:MAG: hypothetical protein ACOYOS_16575 [Syntrophales bacterium]
MKHELSEHGIQSELTEEDCDLFDAVYMPSRYPLFSVLPDAMPAREICEKCVRIARRVGEGARSALKDKADKMGKTNSIVLPEYIMAYSVKLKGE